MTISTDDALMRRLFLLFAALIVPLCSPLTADDQFEWNNVERIVAVGDIHGAYENFVQILENARLIDDKHRWIGGKAHLVQNGDIVDRGPDSRKTMDLLMELEDKAEDAGGRVHVLIGNHEAMNIIGILDLVSDQEFAAFVTRDSRRRLERTFDRYYDQLKREASETGEEVPKKNDLWKEFQEDYPLGYIEHREAFSKDGKYGKWIIGHNTSIKINGILFSHGDWSEKFSLIGLEEVNRRVRQELKGESPIEQGLTFDEVSPLQYRGLAHTPLTHASQEAQMPLVDRILANLEAKRMVVGHTITSGVIESRFGGKHVSIDVGMLYLYRGGHRVALEIVGDEIRALHDNGTVAIPETMDETNFNDYVRAVAEVDPTNVDVQLKLVNIFEEEGRNNEAISILERLFDEEPEFVPFRYREVLGREYAKRGENERAEEQFRLYVKGLLRVVEKNPSNVNLANLLARFCLDKRIELDLAEQTMVGAVSQSTNYGLRITLSRVQLARDEFAKALETLHEGEPAEVHQYESHYISGLAYLGLDEMEKARSAFQDAVNIEPSREEAQQELKKLQSGQNEPEARPRSSAGGLPAVSIRPTS